GYQAAVKEMFRDYIEQEAFAPLVAGFRTWNWEWEYGDFLLELTARLSEAKDWPLLLNLWSAVLGKRRTNYNKTKEGRKAGPNKVAEDLVEKTRGFLLESLERLRGFAIDFGRESEIKQYLDMIAKVERRLNA